MENFFLHFDMTKHVATITLIGNDKAGVIARITQLLFQLGANIEAMEEQVTRGQFSMTLQASWTPARFDRPAIERGVKKAARDLAMEAKVHFAPVGPPEMAVCSSGAASLTFGASLPGTRT